MVRSGLRMLVGLVTVALAATAAGAAADRPIVRMPALEQGSEVKGDVLIDFVMRPADDGTPLAKLDVSIDGEQKIMFDLQPGMTNVTFNWPTLALPDGKHVIVARVEDARGRDNTFQTFVYVWNRGRPQTGSAPARIEVRDSDNVDDGVITSRAVIEVKVDPKLGAKWVILYLNDRMIAMMNYPPYREVLDPTRRNLADGPYVVRAKVIHPDNTETEAAPVDLQVNTHGTLTPIVRNGLPNTGVRPQAGPVTPPTDVPIVNGQVRIPEPNVGNIPTTDAPTATAPPTPLGADRQVGAKNFQPNVIEGPQADFGGAPQPTIVGPAGAGATIPPVPTVTSSPGNKAMATLRQSGPPAPARTGFGQAQAAGPIAGAASLPQVAGTSAVPATTTPLLTARLKPAFSTVGTATPAEAVAAVLGLAAGTAVGGAPVATLPTARPVQPRLGNGTATAPGATAAEVTAMPVTATVAGAPVTGAPVTISRVGAPRVDATVAGSGTLAPGGAPVTVATAPASTQVVLATPAGRRMDTAQTDVRVGGTNHSAAPATVPATGRPAPYEAQVQVTAPTATLSAPKAGTLSTTVLPAHPGTLSKQTQTGVTVPGRVPRAIGKLHVVQKGETLAAVAQRYQVGTRDLARVNGLRSVRTLKPGQRLLVPAKALVVNGLKVKTDVPALEQRQGVTASPLRYVVEALGGTVSWMGPEHRVTANTKDRGVITINIGSSEAQVGDEKVLMDLAAYIDRGRTMVPTRFISQALDVTIEMDERSGNIVVRSNR